MDCYFHVSFVEVQLEKEREFFGYKKFGRPNRYTGLPNSLNRSLVLHTKGVQKFVEIWHTFCTNFVCILYTSILIYKYIIIKLCIQFACKLHTKCMQIIVCKMHPTFQHILTNLFCTSKVIISHNSN